MKKHRVVWVWIAELVVYLLILGSLNYAAFRNDPGFRKLPVSPYFVPILLLALRHGTLAGLASGLSSAILVGMLQRSWNLENGELILPALFVGVGTLVGGSVSSLIHRIRHYRTESDHWEAELRRALRRDDVRETALRELQRTVELEGIPVETLLQLSRGIDSHDPVRMHAALLGFLSARFQADRVGIYERQGDSYRLQAMRIPQGEMALPGLLSGGTGLAALALSLDRPVSVLDAGGISEGIWCAPLHLENQVCALLWIQRMPALQCTPGTMTQLAHLVEWVEQSLERGRLFRAARQAAIHDPEFGVKSPGYLREHLKHELLRHRRYRSEFALLLVRIPGHESLSAAERTKSLGEVAQAIRSSTRSSDLVFTTERRDTLAVVAHSLTHADFSVVQGRIASAAKGYRLRYAAVYASQHAGEPEEMLAHAEKRFE